MGNEDGKVWEGQDYWVLWRYVSLVQDGESVGGGVGKEQENDHDERRNGRERMRGEHKRRKSMTNRGGIGEEEKRRCGGKEEREEKIKNNGKWRTVFW